MSQDMRAAWCSPRFPAEGQACCIFLEPPMILPLQTRVTEYHDLSQIFQFFYNTPIRLHLKFPSGFPGPCAVGPCIDQKEANRTAQFSLFTFRKGSQVPGFPKPGHHWVAGAARIGCFSINHPISISWRRSKLIRNLKKYGTPGPWKGRSTGLSAGLVGK